jgi:hypothetical protein
MMETQSDKIFASQVPSEWVYRKIDLDYGLDREIEIVIDEKLTGKTLLVQLKSSLSIDVAENVIRFSFETNKISYYMERDVPVLLVLVDLKTNICYMLFIQEYVYEKLDATNPLWKQQKTVVLEIPTASTWTSSIDAVREIALIGPFYLAIKKLSSINTETTLKWKTNENTVQLLDEFANLLDTKALQINLDLATRYSIDGKEEKSYQKLLTTYSESKRDPKIRLKVIEGLIWFYNPTQKEENQKLFELSMEGSKLAETIGDKPHALYLRGIVIQALFFKMVNDLTNQRLLQKVSRESKSGFESFVGLSTLKTSQQLTQITIDFVSNMRTVEKERYYTVFTDLLRRHAEMMLYLYQSLILWVDRAQIDDLLQSAETSLNIGMKVCEYMKWDEQRCMILDSMAMLYHFRNDLDRRRSALEQFKEIAKKTGNKGLLIQAEMKSETYEKAPRFITGPKDIPKSRDLDNLSDQEIDQMHKKLLEAGGIDPNGKDELSQLARIGLKDRNPERILKHCEHLYVEVSSYGPIWDMVGLPTTGRKLLYCGLKDCSLEGPTLDELLSEFKEKYCNQCDSHSPRPTDWKWSYRWQRERKQPEKMKMILNKLREF